MVHSVVGLRQHNQGRFGERHFWGRLVLCRTGSCRMDAMIVLLSVVCPLHEQTPQELHILIIHYAVQWSDLFLPRRIPQHTHTHARSQENLRNSLHQIRDIPYWLEAELVNLTRFSILQSNMWLPMGYSYSRNYTVANITVSANPE